MTEAIAGEHPSSEVLSAFVLGRLTPEQTQAVEAHLLGCEPCTDSLAQLPGDDLLVERLRELSVDCPPASAPLENASIGRYRLLEELGRGGMGVVYRALDTRLKRQVAVKLIHAGTHADPERRARLLREAEITAGLRHPGIVQIHEIGDCDNGLYLVLELLEPGGLKALIGEGPQPVRWSAMLVRQLAETLEYAHREGLLHRDLKLENLLLAPEGTAGEAASSAPSLAADPDTPPQVKIVDFGLAVRFAENSGLTLDGMLVGTPDYMAPEQIPGDPRPVGPPADIHALGVILYRLLTGRLPFSDDRIGRQLQQLRDEEPPLPCGLVPGIPQDLETICLKCLAKAPAERYPSAQALADDLGLFLAGEPIRARPPALHRRVLQWARRRPMLATTWLALLVFYLLHLAVVFVLNDRTKEGFFHWYVTAILSAAALYAYLTQEIVEASGRRRLGEYLYAALPPALLFATLIFDRGPSSAPVELYMVAVVGAALIRPHPVMVWVEAGLCLLSYLGLSLVAWRWSPQDLVSVEHLLAQVLTLLCTAIAVHLLLRRISS